jgi:structural maintenance of chromosome 4
MILKDNTTSCGRNGWTKFMTGFNTISLKLKEMYQIITPGGDAELELVDSLDFFAEDRRF